MDQDRARTPYALITTLAFALLAACTTPSRPPPAAAATGEAPAFESPVEFISGDDTLRGTIDVVAGEGPHPTVILFNGFTGWATTPVFADILSSAGFNVVFVPYRGTWGSEGELSADNVLEDARATLEFVRSPEVQDAHRIDPDAIALWGISFGGWAALSLAATEPDVTCVASQVVANMGTYGKQWQASEQVRNAYAENFRRAEANLPIRFEESVDQVMATIISKSDDYDLVRQAPRFEGRKVLLFGAEDDEVNPFRFHYQPVATALSGADLAELTLITAPGKHVDARPEWIEDLAGWLKEDCFGPL